MKTNPIIADPMALDRVGVVSTKQAGVLIHIGRCGLVGTTIPEMSTALRINGSTLTHIVGVLVDLKLITSAVRYNKQGRARNYVVTVRGWNLLTEPADFSMFPHVQTALKTGCA